MICWEKNTNIFASKPIQLGVDRIYYTYVVPPIRSLNGIISSYLFDFDVDYEGSLL